MAIQNQQHLAQHWQIGDPVGMADWGCRETEETLVEMCARKPPADELLQNDMRPIVSQPEIGRLPCDRAPLGHAARDVRAQSM